MSKLSHLQAPVTLSNKTEEATTSGAEPGFLLKVNSPVSRSSRTVAQRWQFTASGLAETSLIWVLVPPRGRRVVALPGLLPLHGSSYLTELWKVMDGTCCIV